MQNKSDKAESARVTLQSQFDKAWSNTYVVEKNMLVTLEKKQGRALETSVKRLKKKWQTPTCNVYQITPYLISMMKYLES